MDEDKKKRLKIISKHPEWTRKIKRAVRDGNICLEMNGEQLTASWGEPSKKLQAFIINAGDFDLWIYTTSKDKFIAVSLKDDRIIGWSKPSVD